MYYLCKNSCPLYIYIYDIFDMYIYTHINIIHTIMSGNGKGNDKGNDSKRQAVNNTCMYVYVQICILIYIHICNINTLYIYVYTYVCIGHIYI